MVSIPWSAQSNLLLLPTPERGEHSVSMLNGLLKSAIHMFWRNWYREDVVIEGRRGPITSNCDPPNGIMKDSQDVSETRPFVR